MTDHRVEEIQSQYLVNFNASANADTYFCENLFKELDKAILALREDIARDSKSNSRNVILERNLRTIQRDIQAAVEDADLKNGPTEITRAATLRLNSAIVDLYPALIETAVKRDKLIYRDAEGNVLPAHGGGDPPAPPIDIGRGSGDDGAMEARLSKLEADVAAIKFDVAVIKANGATKADIAELKGATKAEIAELRGAIKTEFTDLKGSTKADIAELKGLTKADIAELKGLTKADFADLKGSTRGSIAEAKNTIILWVVGAIFLAQLIPAVLKQLPDIIKMLSH